MELIWFIAGVLFVSVIMPLIKAIVGHILMWIEYKQIKYTEAINDGNIRMQKAAASIDDVRPSRTIGFVLSEEEESEDEEDF